MYKRYHAQGSTGQKSKENRHTLKKLTFNSLLYRTLNPQEEILVTIYSQVKLYILHTRNKKMCLPSLVFEGFFLEDSFWKHNIIVSNRWDLTGKFKCFLILKHKVKVNLKWSKWFGLQKRRKEHFETNRERFSIYTCVGAEGAECILNPGWTIRHQPVWLRAPVLCSACLCTLCTLWPEQRGKLDSCWPGGDRPATSGQPVPASGDHWTSA